MTTREKSGTPTDAGSLAATHAEEVDRTCDRFEAVWRIGGRPDLEAYLMGTEGAKRAALARELIAVDVHWRQLAGERPTAEEYLAILQGGAAGYPELPEELRSWLSPLLETFPSPDRSGSGQGGITLPADSAERRVSATHGQEGTYESAPAISGRILPIIPGYDIMRELGRGGMGVVYLAKRARLDRLCALKMILGENHADRAVAVRFLTEAATVAKLRHPNIVQVYHLGEHDQRPYIEMEYVEGGSLAERIDGTPWPPRLAASLVELLAKATAAAHEQGIIHRDLKPGNVLLAADGSPKITDFGLAKSLGADSSLTQSGAIMGSPSYMAPEQAAGGASKVGRPADTYALGAILYELVTGRPPFRAATVLETLEQVKNDEPVAPMRLVPKLPRDVETIVLQCLQKDPDRRYQTVALLAEDLRRYQEDESIMARPVGSLERAGRWCLRNRALAGRSALRRPPC